MRVLLVKLSAFGDIVHAWPVIDDLRRQGAEVHWLMDARFAFMGELLPASVRMHAVDLKGESPWRAVRQACRALRALAFDAVLDLQGLIKSGLMARAASRGAPVYGFDRRESPEWPNAWLLRAVRFHPEERHVVQKYRRIARAPFHDDWRRSPSAPMAYVAPRIEIGQRQHEAAASVLATWRVPHTIIHVGGGWRTKRLEIAQWRALVLALSELGAELTLSWGTEEEYHRARRIADCYDMAKVLPHRLEIHALAGMLHAASVVIGMDTGVLHLAAALGTPTVTLWGPSASWNAGPQGPMHRHVESHPPCGPCFQRRCDRFICLPGLRTEDIVHAWQAVRR